MLMTSMWVEAFWSIINLKEFFFMNSNKEKWYKTEKDRKGMVKENNTDKSDFSQNEIPDLNSLKPFEFEPKQTSEILTVVALMMRKKVMNHKIIRISNSEWC